MKIVLALGMSRPLSTIVVASRFVAMGYKIEHDFFQLPFGHLTVSDAYAGLGHNFALKLFAGHGGGLRAWVRGGPAGVIGLKRFFFLKKKKKKKKKK